MLDFQQRLTVRSPANLLTLDKVGLPVSSAQRYQAEEARPLVEARGIYDESLRWSSLGDSRLSLTHVPSSSSKVITSALSRVVRRRILSFSPHRLPPAF